MRHFNITFQPDGKRVSIHAGASLLEAANFAGIILNSSCGGKGTCKKCTVLIEPDKKQVLACRYIIDCDLTVTVPAASKLYEQKILQHGIDRPVKPTYVKTGTETALGLAVDIGTTTVVAKLIDLITGRLLVAEADFNPQSIHGDDVVSRISYAQSDENLSELQQLIVGCINNLIDRLCKTTGSDRNDIFQMTAVGNTTMTHILLHLPVVQLGQAPYKAHLLDACDITAKELNVKINPGANIRVVENIAGFVGSDTVAAALAVDINLAEKLTLLVDIGTNGELVSGDRNNLYAVSCAAGPALEGARISQGSRAAEGAIESVFINDKDIDVDVIGSKPPTTICGSGIIDAVAVMLDLGVLDSTGRIIKKSDLPPSISKRIITKNNQPAFVIAFTNDGQPAVVLTQQDVREVQLAKAAIAAGVKLLLKKLNITENDIDRILLAGAFGNYIKRASAIRIGLLPNIPEDKIQFVGNAASVGATMILLNTTSRELAGHLARKIQYLEIAHEKEFMNIYTGCMTF
ncbi:MAG: ASKHA domain-containing protein [Phycisphaerae bacterium]|jgi:uncharacterized 2Fe-2S/4Fe-4S cluster protein (DUF4445 family)